MRSALPLAVILIGAISTAGWAQTVKGVLRHRHTGAPVTRAYVVLLDRDSLEVTRALTNALGGFTIHAPRPGTYRLRTELVGFRSVVSAAVTLGDGEVVEPELTVEPVVVQLAALLVEGIARECRVVGDQALEVLAVWEEASKALRAVAWSDLQGLLVYELERFERWYTPSFRLLHEERSTTPTRNVMPFRSRSVDELERLGYVLLQEDSVVYEAPDAEVFFSEPFLQGHCFRLARSVQDRRAMVGLRFEPVGGDSMPDVKGVFWLDGETGALERLELGYVNVGVWQRQRGAAAELEFDRLPDGQWFVSRWWIRMPLVRRVETMKGPVWDLEEAVVGFEEEGGEVRRVYAADGRTLYARGRATVRGVVFDSTSGRGLEGAFVRLVGTSHVTISDAAGSFWLTDLPEGRYTITFTHPRNALFGITGETQVALHRRSEVEADLALPAAQTIARLRCPDSAGAPARGLLVGRVRQAAPDTVIGGARVRVVWVEGGDAAGTARWAEVETDTSGVYRACVPRGAPLSLEVRVAGVLQAVMPAMFGEGPLRELDIEVREPQEVP